MKKTKRIFSLLLVALFSIVLISCGSSNQVSTKNNTAAVETNGSKQAEQVQTKKTGWIQEKGNSYYYNSDGKMQTGWLKDNGKNYYLNSSGIMQKGWIKDNGKDYYCDNSGVMQTGWKESSGKWYYLNADGSMVTNKTVDGYYLTSSGAMQENSVSNSNANAKSDIETNSGGTKYVDANGKGLIKGSKTHIYHVPGSTYYSRTTNVAQWFKTVKEAEAAGYRAPER
jgi:glucan-binding YG repeat protein